VLKVAKVEVFSGICGFKTKIVALPGEKRSVELTLESECPNIRKIIDSIGIVYPFKELFGKLHESEVYKVTSSAIPHPSCPVPAAVLKAVEVAAGLALPKDVHIAIEQ